MSRPATSAVLACFEEGLRHGGLGVVVAEVSRLSMTASRRLRLAAESAGTLGLAGKSAFGAIEGYAKDKIKQVGFLRGVGGPYRLTPFTRARRSSSAAPPVPSARKSSYLR